ncbi:hypothetical protein [Campylobacter jejuni]|uniref:hypothetical protein n=2 Tax=Campylobacter TaxID=194 RepID=UPI000F81415D|nr:hypothetical protein [Campylobacter jejuni]RTJ71747.1 hypothetical protein C3H53_09105 [Campylobacter jejuni]RTJ81143.1 hypothetical protein C3H50_09100 [Campylobacter jejuni]
MAGFQKSYQDILEHIYRVITTPNKIFDNVDDDYFIPHQEKNLEFNYKNAKKERERIIKENYQKLEKRAKTKAQAQTWFESISLYQSAVFDCTAETSAQDIYNSIGKELEKTFNTKIYSIAIHRDEGSLIDKKTGKELTSGADFILDRHGFFWFRKENEKKATSIEKNAKLYTIKMTKEQVLEKYEIYQNFHAHIEFSGLDNDGYSISSKTSDCKNHPKKETRKAFTPSSKKAFLEKSTELLNAELERQGKKPYKNSHRVANLLKRVEKALENTENTQLQELFKDANNDGLKRIKGFKYLASNLESLIHGETLEKKDFNATKTMLKQAGIYDKIKLRNELEEKEKEILKEKEIKKIIDDFKREHTGQGFKKDFFNELRELAQSLKEVEQNELNKLLELILEKHSNQLQELETENANLRARIEELEKETPKEVIKEVENPVNNELKAENERLNEQIKALENEIKETQESIQDLMGYNADESLSLTIESLQDYVEGLRTKINNLEVENALLEQNTPLKAQNAPLNQNYTKNDERQGGDEKNQNLSHSEPSRMETALSGVNKIEINGDDDSAMKALRKNFKG